MLVVSRADISVDEVIEYPVDKRFIKLPIKPYLELLTIGGKSVSEELNRPQIGLINAVNHPKYRFIVACFSRRLGKTFISNVIGQLVTLVPGSNVLIISPNFNLSSISFDLQRKFIKHFDLEIERDNLKDRIIELANGSTIRMGSVSTVDSTVGRSYDLIIFDEAALSEAGKEAFNVSLRPTLDKPNSKAIFISTPRGKNNYFAEFFRRGFTEEYAEWCSLHADYTENERMQQSDVDEAKRSMSKAEFEQEYLANFNTYEGQIYSLPTPNYVEHEFIMGDDKYEFFSGIDPGYKDPTAFVVIGYRASDDTFHIVDEYLKSEAVTSKHAEIFKEKIDKWGIDANFIDSAAAQFAADLAYSYDISTIKSKKDVLPGIAYVQNLIESGRVYVYSNCVEVMAALDQYQWDDREGLQREKPKHTHSHIPDAIRYALYTYIP